MAAFAGFRVDSLLVVVVLVLAFGGCWLVQLLSLLVSFGPQQTNK
jgi:hypothetical protein